MFKTLRYFDWPFFVAVVLLCLVGLTMIYSTGVVDQGGFGPWVRQLAAFILGLAGLIFLGSLDYRFFRKNSTFFYVVGVLALIGVLIFGPDIRGTRRWFDLGLFNFQPSEFVKFALIVILAKFFDRKGPLLQRFSSVLVSLLYVLIPVGLILLQPDLGSTLILLGAWIGMLLVSPMPKRYLLYLLVIFLLIASLSWQFLLADYQKSRVQSFLDPTSDPLGGGYNALQSIVAVGSGGFLGQGLARGLQSQLKFLPERQTDFIFASTVEELGFVGGSLVLVLFLFVFIRLIRIARTARDRFGFYLAIGIFFVVFVQMAINVGMNLGLLPVTGMTLPFLSFGGSSLVITLWMMGIIQNIAKNSVPVRFG